MEQVFELLRLADWAGESEAIEIAKGKNELPTTFKKGITQIKRQWQILTK